MRFWDTSALVPRFLDEARAADVKRWYLSDPETVVWSLTRVELISAIARRHREKPEFGKLWDAAIRNVLAAWQEWSEVTDFDRVRKSAERLLGVHPLRVADALQLGAAVVIAEGNPQSLEFVTLDRRLAEAAHSEGFPVLI